MDNINAKCPKTCAGDISPKCFRGTESILSFLSINGNWLLLLLLLAVAAAAVGLASIVVVDDEENRIFDCSIVRLHVTLLHGVLEVATDDKQHSLVERWNRMTDEEDEDDRVVAINAADDGDDDDFALITLDNGIRPRWIDVEVAIVVSVPTESDFAVSRTMKATNTKRLLLL